MSDLPPRLIAPHVDLDCLQSLDVALQLADGLYNVIAWLLAGLVMARFVPETVEV